MKNFELFIFNNTSRSNNYGIGTYIDQLKIVLLRRKIRFTIISLFSKKSEILFVNKNGFNQIYIPSYELNPFILPEVQEKRYYRNVSFILSELIENKPSNIFHLNSMANKTLAKSLKNMFSGRVILTVHYTDWSFNLLGNYELLKSLLVKKKTQIKDELHLKTI